MTVRPSHMITLSVHTTSPDEWHLWWDRLDTVVQAYILTTPSISLSSIALDVEDFVPTDGDLADAIKQALGLTHEQTDSVYALIRAHNKKEES